MNTHLVTDNHYFSEEDMYIAFIGSHEECTKYKQEQSEISFADTFCLTVVPMTEAELYQYNPDYREEVDKKLINKHESDKAIIDYAFTEKKPFKMSYGFNPETQTFQKKPFQKD